MFKAITLQQLPENLYQLCQILQQASQIIQTQYALYQQGDAFDIQHKEDQSPVTQADLLVNTFLIQQLAQYYPEIPVLSEENEHHARHLWSEYWLLDPLDGTKEFINQTGEFTINLSFMKNGEALISALAVPMQQVVYIGEAMRLPFRWMWGEKALLAQYTHDLDAFVQRNDSVLTIAMSRRPQRSGRYADFLAFLDNKGIVYEKVVAGSAYKFCMMLEGKIDVYPRFHPTSEWDTAAGQGLLKSIGGNICALSGEPFLYNQRQTLLNDSFIAIRQLADWTLIASFLANDSHEI